MLHKQLRVVILEDVLTMMFGICFAVILEMRMVDKIR
jgi:hypothetical protein